MSQEVASDIREELQNRFLTYALSTIVSRSLPDVRDGLKPIHRRILYAMDNIGLTSASKHVKSAKIIGEVLGKYHPHGDGSTYDSMVRMAQDFSMRYPLVDGKGNYGSIDGDAPAAYRYTEGRLTAITAYILNDIKKDTVDFRPNYDNTLKEPVVLPSRVPNLLLNGSSGIAVGMACSFPSHNLSEVVAGLKSLIDSPDQTVAQLMKHIKGPDFPSAGIILTSKTEIRKAYEEGLGTIKMRGEWSLENLPRGKVQIIVESIPYGVNKARLIEKTAEIIINKKLPPLLDVRDESDEKIRVVLETKPGSEPEKIMAYLFKHTELETNFQMNFNCLKPNGEPDRLTLLEICQYFLEFRVEVITRRTQYELDLILKRLHILEAFVIVFNNLDKALKLIRSSKSRKEAQEKLMNAFSLDEEQSNAILEIPLYRLVSLEIDKLLKEQKEKIKERKRLETLLKSPKKIREEIKSELDEIDNAYKDKRKTKIKSLETVDFNEDDFIQHENVHLVLSRNGWIRKFKNLTDPGTLKFKDNDGLLAVIPSNTRDLLAIFTSFGMVYVHRALNFTYTRSGFGDPIQNIFNFKDGEKVVCAFNIPSGNTEQEADPASDDASKQASFEFESTPSPSKEVMVASAQGYGFRFDHSSLTETTRSGKKIMSLKGEDRMIGVAKASTEDIFLASVNGKGFILPLDQVTLLSGRGMGVKLMKLADDDALAGFKFVELSQKATLCFEDGSQKNMAMKSVPVYNRGSQGVILSKRKKIKTVQ